MIFILMNAIELLADLVILLLVGDYWGVILILLWITLKSAIPAGLILLLMFGLIFLRIRKEYNSDRMIKSELSYTINKEGIKQKIRRSTTYYEWEDIFKVCEKRDMFLVYVSRNKAILLPKRYFNLDDEIVTFKNLVRDRLTEKKIKIK